MFFKTNNITNYYFQITCNKLGIRVDRTLVHNKNKSYILLLWNKAVTVKYLVTRKSRKQKLSPHSKRYNFVQSSKQGDIYFPFKKFKFRITLKAADGDQG
jgi:hypothetical protein